VNLTRVIAPACEPVTLAELKEDLRLLSAGQDALLTRIISAARLRAERYCNRGFINSTWEATFVSWPTACAGASWPASRFSGRALLLPRGTVQAVTWVKYLDAAGAQQTFASSSYTVDSDALPGRIVLKPSESWPSLGDYPSAVRVRYEAGYAPTGTTAAADLRAAVPESVRLAIRFLAAHYFSNPAPVVTGTIATPIPEHAMNLLNDERLHSFGFTDEEATA